MTMKVFWRVVWALPLLVTMLTACGDSNDGPEDTSLAELAGGYEGTVNMNVMGTEVDPVGATVTVACKDDGEGLLLTLPELHFGNFTIPSTVVDAPRVSHSGDIYVIEAAPIPSLKGELRGSISGSELRLDYSQQPGSMPMVIQTKFLGRK